MPRAEWLSHPRDELILVTFIQAIPDWGRNDVSELQLFMDTNNFEAKYDKDQLATKLASLAVRDLQEYAKKLFKRAQAKGAVYSGLVMRPEPRMLGEEAKESYEFIRAMTTREHDFKEWSQAERVILSAMQAGEARYKAVNGAYPNTAVNQSEDRHYSDFEEEEEVGRPSKASNEKKRTAKLKDVPDDVAPSATKKAAPLQRTSLQHSALSVTSKTFEHPTLPPHVAFDWIHKLARSHLILTGLPALSMVFYLINPDDLEPRRIRFRLEYDHRDAAIAAHPDMAKLPHLGPRSYDFELEWPKGVEKGPPRAKDIERPEDNKGAIKFTFTNTLQESDLPKPNALDKYIRIR